MPPESQAQFLSELRRRRRIAVGLVGAAVFVVAAAVGSALCWEAAEFLGGIASLGTQPTLRTGIAVVAGYGPAAVGAYFLTTLLGSIAALRKSDAWIDALVAKGADRSALVEEIKHW